MGTPVRRDQEGVQRGSRAGDYDTPGSREDSVRLFLLQPDSGRYLGEEAITWALVLLLEEG